METPKIIHVQTVMLEETVKKLKAATGEGSVKEALSKAAEYYIAEHPKGGEK